MHTIIRSKNKEDAQRNLVELNKIMDNVSPKIDSQMIFKRLEDREPKKHCDDCPDVQIDYFSMKHNSMPIHEEAENNKKD